MSTFGKCPDCGNYHSSDRSCGNQYLVYDEDYMGEEGRAFYAFSFEAAAIEYAEYYNNSGDHALVDDEREIEVEYEGERKRFRISAEPEIRYNADEI